MNINDFLQIILDNDYSVYASGNIGHEQVRVSVDSLAFSLCIKPTSSTGVILELNHTYKTVSSAGQKEPTLEVEICDIQHFMDAISEKKLIDFYKQENWNRSHIEESKKLIDVFKNILEEKPISAEYCFKNIKNEEFPYGAIELTEKNSGAIHMLDFTHFFPKFGARQVRVCTDNLKVLININVNNCPQYNFKIPTEFTFNIPAYDIVKYPLLKKQNDFKSEHNHTEFSSWLKHIIEYPHVSKKNLKEKLSTYLFNESLNEKLDDSKQAKPPKIKI